MKAPPKLLREKAYTLLKRKIVTLEYPVGSQLLEQEICEELGIGRTPVREALQRLAAEKLVTIIPRRGMFVSEINFWELQRLIEARLMVDVFCARTAASIASPVQIRALKDLVGSAQQWAAERRIPDLLETDRRFHLHIVAFLENPFISETAEKIYDQMFRTWFLSFSRRTGDEILDTLNEHLSIVEALEARNPDTAERAVRRHVENYRRKLMQEDSAARNMGCVSGG
ncbi:DNA-binding transcriptional regulator, GntR family [Desulfacinum infernum DSM 9756]|uniref:DNA-binding transcriptional regulator, GntR family n=1 Tax=Desulfacinum infernum DSM 9756 TaxID=1121391 RepID=A0A1M4UE47_9BACT|nr:GntR family transcriptional regulator [Desulfacinum infernum]SHE55111.1 DNA-binding transcriptional regulator, GntR family [Desulfacinum infernum DSM 9756]